MTSRSVRVSKFLSLVLRHDPGRIGLELDAEGWAPIDSLLAASAEHGMPISLEELEEVVAQNPKQRFAIDDSTGRIRANQGHSIDIDLGLVPAQPPDELYHGTARRTLPAILAEGLRPMTRQYVHLSIDESTAFEVGRRHGAPVVLAVDSQRMASEGHVFLVSQNGVWLTKAVPPTAIRLLGQDNP